MDDEMEKAMHESLSAIREAQSLSTIREPKAVSKINGSSSSELARLNDTIETLYKTKRQQVQDIKARHAEERVKVINDYARRHEDLQIAASEALQTLDMTQNQELEPLLELLRRVEGMR